MDSVGKCQPRSQGLFPSLRAGLKLGERGWENALLLLGEGGMGAAGID